MIVDPIVAGSLTVIGGLSATVFMQKSPEAHREPWEIKRAKETLGPPNLRKGLLRMLNPFERIWYFHRTEKLGHEILLAAGYRAEQNIIARQTKEQSQIDKGQIT